MTESGHIPDDATPIFHEIDNQSDRAAAVVAGSFVERALQIAIEAEWHIPSNTVRDRIFTGNGPLATFSGKIEFVRLPAGVDEMAFLPAILSAALPKT